MLRRFTFFLFLTVCAMPLLAASARGAGDDTPKGDGFPHASRFQERRAVPAARIHVMCADCEELPPIDDGLTPGGMPSAGCNNLHVCTTTKGCIFAVYARCFLGSDAHPEWGQWYPCTAC